MTVTTIDRTTLRMIQARVMAALKPLEAELGITLSPGGGAYGGASGKVTIAMTVNDASGAPVLTGKLDFERYAVMFGLKVSDFGRTFMSNRSKYEITGMKASARTYPILAKNLLTGKEYKFPASAVIAALSLEDRKSPPAAEVPPIQLKVPYLPDASLSSASARMNERLFG